VQVPPRVPTVGERRPDAVTPTRRPAQATARDPAASRGCHARQRRPQPVPSTTQAPQHHASRGGARVHRSPGGI